MSRRQVGFLGGLLAAILVAALDSPIGAAGSRPALAAATVVLMVAWWATEALPLWATALVPLVVFPIAGVHAGSASGRIASSSAPYVDAYVFLYLGGMAIAAGLETTGLSGRIARAVLERVGSSPGRLVLGVMAATASVSLWISNTASAALVMPIALALLVEIEGATPRPRYAAALVLAVAWGANLGGIGTKIGTATNAQLAAFLAARSVEVTFSEFSAVGLGFVLVLAPIAAWMLARAGRADAPSHAYLATVLARRASAPRAWSSGERAVLAVFAATALLWVLAQPIRVALEGLELGLRLRTAHVEAAAALLAAGTLLVLRPGGRALIGRASLRRMPWSALPLLGGSFALAAGIESSGLSHEVAPLFARLADEPPFVQTLGAALITVCVSAFASNTATIGILMPILAAALSSEHLATILFAAGISSSCDFALPAGTPPNAIAFGTGRVPLGRMVRTGAALDLVAAVVAAAWCALVVPRVIG